GAFMPLAAPKIVEELSVCSTAVRISGQLHGARVDILVDGVADPVGGGLADWPDQWFALNPGVGLQPGQSVRARQAIGGETSAAWVGVAVSRALSTPGRVFAAPLVFCSGIAGVPNLAPGAPGVGAAADGGVLGSTTPAGGRAVVSLARIFPPAE